MRQVRDNLSLEAGQSLEQKGSHSGSTKKREQSPLCISEGPMSSQNLGIGIKNPEVHKLSCTSWKNCER